jgi:hypothetical protein
MIKDIEAKLHHALGTVWASDSCAIVVLAL